MKYKTGDIFAAIDTSLIMLVVDEINTWLGHLYIVIFGDNLKSIGISIIEINTYFYKVGEL